MEKKSVGWEGFKGFLKGYLGCAIIGVSIFAITQNGTFAVLTFIGVWICGIKGATKKASEAEAHNLYIDNQLKIEEQRKNTNKFITSKVMEEIMNAIKTNSVRRIEIKKAEVCCLTLSGMKLVSKYQEYGYKNIESSFAKEIAEVLLHDYMNKDNYRLREITEFVMGSGAITGFNIVNNPYGDNARVFVDRDYGDSISLGYAIELKEKEQSKIPQLKDW